MLFDLEEESCNMSGKSRSCWPCPSYYIPRHEEQYLSKNLARRPRRPAVETYIGTRLSTRHPVVDRQDSNYSHRFLPLAWKSEKR